MIGVFKGAAGGFDGATEILAPPGCVLTLVVKTVGDAVATADTEKGGGGTHPPCLLFLLFSNSDRY